LISQHRAFESEFRAIVASQPVRPGDRVLDLACGDGAYSRWFAEAGANVVALDLSAPFLELARQVIGPDFAKDRVRLVQAALQRLPLGDNTFDLVWCAQSLYSLPDPLDALRKMREKTSPRGRVAVLENDQFHHVLLPWPVELELALREAELIANVEQSSKPRKFYVGRQLLELFHVAGLTDCQLRAWTFDRQAPLESCEREYFSRYLDDLYSRTRPHLRPEFADLFDRLACAESADYLLDSPHFAATCVNYVICSVNDKEESVTSDQTADESCE
jgi:ubiquinone/menaquinone biosynthesis C-methylase UbiE